MTEPVHILRLPNGDEFHLFDTPFPEWNNALKIPFKADWKEFHFGCEYFIWFYK